MFYGSNCTFDEDVFILGCKYPIYHSNHLSNRRIEINKNDFNELKNDNETFNSIPDLKSINESDNHFPIEKLINVDNQEKSRVVPSLQLQDKDLEKEQYLIELSDSSYDENDLKNFSNIDSTQKTKQDNNEKNSSKFHESKLDIKIIQDYFSTDAIYYSNSIKNNSEIKNEEDKPKGILSRLQSYFTRDSTPPSSPTTPQLFNFNESEDFLNISNGSNISNHKLNNLSTSSTKVENDWNIKNSSSNKGENSKNSLKHLIKNSNSENKEGLNLSSDPIQNKYSKKNNSILQNNIPETIYIQDNDDNDDIMKSHIMEDIFTRLYFTYRKSIPQDQLIGNRLSSDKGWGCLIRSGQMLFSEALLRLYLGRRWRRHFVDEIALKTFFLQNSNIKSKNNSKVDVNYPRNQNSNSWKFVTSDTYNGRRLSHYELQQISLFHHVLHQFFDIRSAPFSIQRICEHAERNYGIRVGEWFAPTNIAVVLRDLLNVNQIENSLAGAYVCEDSAIYLDEIEMEFGSDRIYNFGKRNLQKGQFFNFNEDFQGKNIDKILNTNYLAPFLLLIPTKLGINKSNVIYEKTMKRALECPYSVGIAGGKRNHSLYFFGHDNSSFLYFDPHTTQHLSQDIDTYHFPREKQVKCLKYSHVDPSMLFGFLIRTRDEWNDFLNFAKKNFCGKDAILSIQKSRPTRRIREEIVIENDDEWQTIM